ncbi:unnamed protein product [Urochloa humidicola]
MGNAISAAVPVLCAAMSAIELVHLLDPQPGGGTTNAAAAQAPALCSAVRAFLPLAAVGALFTAVAHIYRHVHDAGAGNRRRLSEVVTFLLCASAGLLDFSLFVAPTAPAGGAADHPAGAARELGLAALRALPAAAAVTFYLGILLITIRHIRAGGEGGGGDFAGNGPAVEAPAVGVLDKMAIGAAAGLVCLMAIALYGA